MGLYEAIKDAYNIAQKADNIELIQKMLDVQKLALDMQEKQQQQNKKIVELEKELETLSDLSKYEFADGKNYLIDPAYPSRRFCPLCTKSRKIPVPIVARYCSQCKGNY